MSEADDDVEIHQATPDFVEVSRHPLFDEREAELRAFARGHARDKIVKALFWTTDEAIVPAGVAVTRDDHGRVVAVAYSTCAKCDPNALGGDQATCSCNATRASHEVDGR